MQNLYFVAHAGEEHLTEADAVSHSTTSLTTVIVICAITVLVLTFLLRLLSRSASKRSTKAQKTQ